MIPVSPRVVIAGAGPGGLAAAIALKAAGATVMVVEKAVTSAPDRSRAIVLTEQAARLVRNLGAADAVDHPLAAATGNAKVVSLRRLDSSLAEIAAAAGIDIRRGQSVTDAARGANDLVVGVVDVSTGAASSVGADWLIDATGGRSVTRSLGSLRKVPTDGPLKLTTGERTWVTALGNADSSRPAGISDPDGTGAFALNDIREGVMSIYQPVDGTAAALHRDPAAMDEALGTALKALGVSGDGVGTPKVIHVEQQLAPHAIDGRIISVGDSVGTMLPVRQQGVGTAIQDGTRAAELIMKSHGASAKVATGLAAEYDRVTVAMHKAFLL